MDTFPDYSSLELQEMTSARFVDLRSRLLSHLSFIRENHRVQDWPDLLAGTRELWKRIEVEHSRRRRSGKILVL